MTTPTSERTDGIHSKTLKQMTAVATNDTEKQSPMPSLEEEEDHRTLKESKQTVDSIVRYGVKQEIAKQVVRKKLSKLRHLVVKEAISPEYLDSLFPRLMELFKPQTVTVRGVPCVVECIVISLRSELMLGLSDVSTMEALPTLRNGRSVAT